MRDAQIRNTDINSGYAFTYGASRTGLKSAISGYQNSIVLAVILFVVCAVAIVSAQQISTIEGPAQIWLDSPLVTAQPSDQNVVLRQIAYEATLATSRQAINILIGALVIVVLISIAVALHLNSRLVKTTREANHKIVQQNSDLRETKNVQDRFLTSATHELNTPLTVTTALTDVLAKNRDGNLTQRQLTQLAAVQRNNRHLQAMVDLMIQTSVAGENRDMETESIQYSDFMKSALDTIKGELEPQGVTLEWAVSPSDDLVDIDSNKVAKAVTSLVINAGQHSPEGAIVFVSTERTNGHIQTCIRDFGAGISEDDRAHVFSPFYRADTERNRRIRGAGLGLTLVRKIIESQGGKVGFTNNDDEPGTTFCFTLPVLT